MNTKFDADDLERSVNDDLESNAMSLLKRRRKYY